VTCRSMREKGGAGFNGVHSFLWLELGRSKELCAWSFRSIVIMRTFKFAFGNPGMGWNWEIGVDRQSVQEQCPKKGVALFRSAGCRALQAL